MILSFAWTTDVLLARKKTCTRRVWSERTARAWVNAHQGNRLLHSAWNKCSCVKGAKKIADIQLTQLPYQERLADMSFSDLDAEGGLWGSKDEFINLFGSPDTVVWVVRFQLMLPLVDTHGTGLQLGNAPWVDIAPMSALELGHTTNSVGRKHTDERHRAL